MSCGKACLARATIFLARRVRQREWAFLAGRGGTTRSASAWPVTQYALAGCGKSLFLQEAGALRALNGLQPLKESFSSFCCIFLQRARVS